MAGVGLEAKESVDKKLSHNSKPPSNDVKIRDITGGGQTCGAVHPE
jgi:hypothetical protein